MVQIQSSVTSHRFDAPESPAEVSISRFQGQSGVEEYHLMVRPTGYGSIDDQLEWVSEAYQSALSSVGLEGYSCVFRRFFCSDLNNQAAALETHPLTNPRDPGEPCAVSCVCQPPAPPAKIALWAYHVTDPGSALDRRKEGRSLFLRRGDLTHVWTTGVTCTDTDTSYSQTEDILEKYERRLRALGMSLADNVIRTWFFVQNMDGEYQGLVDARREVFARRGLTPDTHFIASTGIGGQSADVAAKVMMDAYAISGVRDGQVELLSAPKHLSPTHMYGVTFERGVSVAYRDRRHVIISGTASIDHAGGIVHPGDLLRQLDRTLENVEALLEIAGAGLQDVCSFIVYVRDPSDLEIAQRTMWDRFGPTPVSVVTAQVCRPGWLIEVECFAIVPADCPGLPGF